MAENKMLKGLVIGAFAGVVVSLIDGPTRRKTADCLKQSGNHAKDYAKNPSHAIHDLRIKYEHWSSSLDTRIRGFLDTLDQMEGYLNKVEKSEEPSSNHGESSAEQEESSKSLQA